MTNRPVNFNDPTGHRACGDTEEYDCDGTRNRPTPPLPPKDPPGGGSGGPGSGGNNSCNEPNPSVVCLPTSNPTQDLPLFPIQPGEWTIPNTASPNIPDLQDLDDWAWFAENALRFLDYLSSAEDLMNSTRPVYRQVKYAFGTGGLEAVVDSIDYGLRDRWSTSLTATQRVSRMAIVGGQSFLIDRASDKVGMFGVPFGGKAGEIAVQYIFSAAVTEFVAPKSTYWLFDVFDLGVPIDIRPIK